MSDNYGSEKHDLVSRVLDKKNNRSNDSGISTKNDLVSRVLKKKEYDNELKAYANSGQAGKELSDRINTWLKNSGIFINNYNHRTSKAKVDTYDSTSQKWLDTITEQKKNFDLEADNIRSILNTYGKYFNEDWVGEINKALDERGKTHNDIIKGATGQNDYWKQFSSAEEYEKLYDNHIYGTKYEGKTYADTQKSLESATGREKKWLTSNADSFMTSADAQSEIDKLNAEIKKLNNEDDEIAWGYNPQGKKPEDIRTEISSLQSRIKTLEGIRDTAKRSEDVEKWNVYSDKAAEFHEYFGKVSKYILGIEKLSSETGMPKESFWATNFEPKVDDEELKAILNGTAVYKHDTSELGLISLFPEDPLSEQWLSNVLASEQYKGLLPYGEYTVSERLELEKVFKKMDSLMKKSALYQSKGAQSGKSPAEIALSDAGIEGNNKNWHYLEENEYKMYSYLLYTYGVEKADEYLDDIQWVLDKRATDDVNDDIKKTISETSGFEGFLVNAGYSIASIPANIIGGVSSFVDNTLHQLKGESINPYSNAQSFRNFANTVRSEIGNEIADTVTWELFGQNVMQNVYNAGMSAADSLVGAYTMGSFYTIAAGTGAAANQAAELYERGASNDQIFWGSIAAGTTELLTEKIPIENLLKMKNPASKVQIVKEIFKQAGIEASEEFASEIINTLADSVIMANNSELSNLIETYENGYYDENGNYHQGVSHEEAVKKAYSGKVSDIFWSAVQGFLSGGMSGTLSTTVQAAHNVKVGKNVKKLGDVDSLLNAGLASKEGSEARKIAEMIQTRVNKGKAPTSMSLGALKSTTLSNMAERANAPALTQNDIEQTLREFGASEAEIPELSRIINKAQSKSLTDKEMNTIKSSEAASSVMSLVMLENNIVRSEAAKTYDEVSAYGEENKQIQKDAFDKKTSRTMTVSSDGITRLTETGEGVEIADVASVDGKGDVYVKLTNGKTVNTRDISFSNDNEAALYEQIGVYINDKDASVGIHPSAAKEIIGLYNSSLGVSPEEFLKAAAIAYKYGKYNLPKRELSEALPEALRDHIYDLGHVFMENKIKQNEEKRKAAEKKEKITEDMPEADRVKILKEKVITIGSLNAENTLGVDELQLKKNIKSMVEKPLLRKLREMGCFRSYKTDSVDIEFEFTGMNMRKSMNSQVSDYGGTLSDLAKIVTNMQEILDDAVLIEIHSDKAKGTKKENARLVKTYVLLSAFFDNNSIVPVQFEIKHFVDNHNRLYLVAALTKVETGVMGDTVHQNDERTRLLPVSKISIPHLISKINPKDANFFKYIPDELLDARQIQAKERALSKENEKYGRVQSSVTDEKEIAEQTIGTLSTTEPSDANSNLYMTSILQKALHVNSNDMQDGAKNTGKLGQVFTENKVNQSEERIKKQIEYSFKEYSSHQLENWKDSKTIIPYKNQKQLSEFIDKALSDNNYNKKIYFGQINDDLALRIKTEFGLSVEDYNCVLRADEVRKILRNSHGDQISEGLRGQRQIKKEDIMDIPLILQNPDSIELSPKQFEGKPVLVFRKELHGKETVVAYVSKKHMDLTVQTMFSGKEKSHSTTPIGNNTLSHTSETLSVKAFSNNMVSQNEPSVNSNDMQDSANNTRKEGKLLSETTGESFEIDEASLNDDQKAGLYTAKILSKALGINVYVYESYLNAEGKRVYLNADGKEVPARKGFYDAATGAIHIDLNAGKDTLNGKTVVLYTLSHELVHFIRQWSPSKFKMLADFLVSKYGEQGISVDALIHNQIKNAKEDGRTITYDTAYEEVIADSMQTMLSSGNVVESLVELKKTDRTLWGKIKSFIFDMLGRLKKALGIYKNLSPDTIEGNLVTKMKDSISELERLFTEGLADASENFKKTDVSKFETSEGVKYSGASYANSDFAEYEVQTALYDALDHEDRGDENLISVGRMPQYITNLIGIDGEFYIYRNHAYENMVSKEQAIKDGRYNSKAHYHNLGIETMTDALMSLNDPIMTISTKSKEGNPTVIMLLAVQGNNNAPLYAVLSFYSNKPINGSYSTKPHIVLTIAERSFFNNGGRAGINEVVKSAIEDGRVLDFDKKKRDALSVIAKTTRLGNITESSLKDSIAQFRKTVKSFKEKHKIHYSSASTDLSPRNLLSNALESEAKTDAERKKLAQYKEKISDIEALEDKLEDINRQIREISFSKGPRDMDKLRSLQDDKIKTMNRIDIADKQLLRLETAKALQDIVERQIKLKLNDMKADMKEQYKQADERREKTLRRNQIRKTVDDLNRLLTRPTKEKHVPIWLQKPVAEFLNALEKTADPKLRYYDSKIEKLENELEALKHDPNATEEMLIKKETELNNAKGRWLKTSDHLSEILEAYKRIEETKDPEIAVVYRSEIAEKLEKIIKDIGRDVPLSEMTLSNLNKVFTAVRLVERVISVGNKMFSAKSKKVVTEYARDIASEITSNSEESKSKLAELKKELTNNKLVINNLKPLTLAKMIGSDTLTVLIDRMIDSESTWAIDRDEAKTFYEEVAKENKIRKSDFDKELSITLSGEEITLTRGEIAALYALSKRKKAVEHLTTGGFYLRSEDNQRAKAYKISKEELSNIGNLLENEQRQFADKMRKYLSGTMASKGNETSRIMYGTDLFADPEYFPMEVEKTTLPDDKQVAETVAKRTKNLGMTKQTKPGAGNALVISDFFTAWDKHINDMALYHAVTTVEDFNRVWNSKLKDKNGGVVALKKIIEEKCGEEIVAYFEKLINDANVGVRMKDYNTTAFFDTLVSRSKKAAVLGSLSVAVQQISAVERAKAYIPGHFFTTSLFSQLKNGHKTTWEEMKKYCPVAIIKEMGGYDLTGRNTMEWTFGSKGVIAKIDNALGRLPALMDEVAWCAIWEAGKKMTASLRGKNGEVLYEKGSEAFYTKASEIVTEAIRHTQVYDSIFVRSGHMRNDDWLSKTATTFMAEPTTSFNMYVEAAIDLKRGGEIRTAGGYFNARRFALRKIRGVISASIGAALTAALVHAMRDDDEEKTLIEKYAGHATRNVMDNINPLNMLPFGRDIVSLVNGYDVKRADMTLISDLIYTFNGLDSDKPTREKISELAGSISNIFGVPYKNIRRDTIGILNSLFNSVPLSETTWLGVKESVSEEVSGKEVSNSDLLYEAMLGGNKKEIGRIKARYDGESEIRSAIRKGLRENDPRIKEAATLNINGDMKGYAEIVNEIASEKVFDKNRIIEAINLEINAINRENKVADNEPIDEDETVTSLFNASMLNRTLDGGDTETALEMIDDMVNAKVKSGKTEKEAKSSIKSNVTRYWKEKYIAAWKAGNDEEMLRIRKLLAETKLYGSAYNVSSTVSSWLKDSVK